MLRRLPDGRSKLWVERERPAAGARTRRRAKQNQRKVLCGSWVGQGAGPGIAADARRPRESAADAHARDFAGGDVGVVVVLPLQPDRHVDARLLAAVRQV